MSQTPNNPAPAPGTPSTTPAATPPSAPQGGGEGPILGGAPAGNVNDTLLGNVGDTPTPGAGTAPAPGVPPQQDPPATPPVTGLAPLPENASDDQKRDFQNKLRALSGVPDAPEAYGNFGFPEEVKIDTKSDDYKFYTGLFHKIGLNQTQAKELLEQHQKRSGEMVEHIKKHNDQIITDYRAQMKSKLVSELGGEAQYGEFVGTATRGFKAAAMGAQLSDPEIKGLLNIMGDDPRFVKIFNHIGKNFREDVLISGATPSAPEKTFENIFGEMFKS